MSYATLRGGFWRRSPGRVSLVEFFTPKKEKKICL